jgi:uncharacterized protein
VIRRISLPWPDGYEPQNGELVRLLAVSDEPERALDFERNRAEVGKIDAVVGCGDLEPDYLSYLADAFKAPLIYIRGNHDRGANWKALAEGLPETLAGRCDWIDGITLLGLSWPGDDRATHAIRDEQAAWFQALPLGVRKPPNRPLIVLSHVPPRGLGDTPEDHYHRGFAAYEWLYRRLNPTLWLHGHTSMAASDEWRVTWGDTTFVNVTGAVVVEMGEAA